MKVLFVIHKLDYADHIAIAYLSAIAKQLKHQVFFCNLDTDDESAFVARIRPDVVAYSVNILGFEAIVEAHKRALGIHKFFSIMGGPHPTFSPETFPESGVDAYCVGEGDYVFRDFLLKVESGETFDDVDNLITKSRANPVRPLIKNLDDLPFPDRDLVLANSFLKKTPKKTFYASRGCPFQCAYCCNNYYRKLYQGKGPAMRRFSVDRIIQEIGSVRGKYRMDFIKFEDDVFAIRNDEWLEEFAEKYSAQVKIPFNCYLRIDLIDDDLLKVLKKAGCFSVHLSIDSTSEFVREKILSRGMRKVDTVAILKKIKTYGINTWVNYMLAAPGSTLQDDLDTISLSRKGQVTYTNYTTTVPMKGTRLYDYCVEQATIDRATHKSDMTGCSGKSTLSCFSEKEKNVRYNIYLLGPVMTKLPKLLYVVALWIVKFVPPNRYFEKFRAAMHRYYIENKIFLLNK